MYGPDILARTMSVAKARGTTSRAWQYHPRSDTHSKVACWTLLVDVMNECDVFREAARKGLLGFGINHVMAGPINKTLDLVVTRRAHPPARPSGRDLGDVARELGIVLDERSRELLAGMPRFVADARGDVQEVAIALEAKACMTEHVKSLPRLHAEILATGYLAKRASPHSITVSYTLVNTAPFFVSPSGEGRKNAHAQPGAARAVIEMLDRAVPKLSETRDYGYDVIGVTTVDCRNDGTPVAVVSGDPFGVGSRHQLHYERMVRNLCSQFRARFG
jgi:hypothetical protein